MNLWLRTGPPQLRDELELRESDDRGMGGAFSHRRRIRWECFVAKQLDEKVARLQLTKLNESSRRSRRNRRASSGVGYNIRFPTKRSLRY